MKLKKAEIDLLACPPGRKDAMFTDEEIRGFTLRVTSAGAKVFLFQYRRGDRVFRVALGRYGEITPAQARKLAEQARGDLARGGHPAAEKQLRLAADRAERAELRQAAKDSAYTLEQLVQDWVATGLKDRSAAHRREAPARLKQALPGLWRVSAAAITAADAQRAIDRVAQRTPVVARRVRAYASAAFNWAKRRELVPANPFAAVAIEAREVSRDRALNEAELGALWNATGLLAYPFGPLLRVLLLTLQRRSEVAGMRWSELAADRATWTIPAARAKNRKAHTVHLVPEAQAIIDAIPRRASSDLVFTTTGRTPVSGFSRAVEQLRTLMEPELTAAGQDGAADRTAAAPWRLHDFRRTGVTMLAALKVPPHVADRLLNHVQGSISGVAAVYQRHEFMAERETAMRQWAAHVISAAKRVPGVPDR